jgi:hypothetical protein
MFFAQSLPTKMFRSGLDFWVAAGVERCTRHLGLTVCQEMPSNTGAEEESGISDIWWFGVGLVKENYS